MTDERAPDARPEGAAREMPSPASRARVGRREPEGFARFVVIVLATFAGSIGCWMWVRVLILLGARAEGRIETLPPLGIVPLLDPIVWEMGAWCGLWLALPAVSCLWNRRLVPALLFVNSVGYGVATGCLAAGGLDGLLLAIPMTAAAVFLALLVVRFFPSRWWTREPDLVLTT